MVEDKIRNSAYKIAKALEGGKDILIKKDKDGEIRIQALKVNIIK